MRQYKPRRAGKKWLEGAPEDILDCFDNRGKTFDRYTILFAGKKLFYDSDGTCWISLLDMSPNPEWIQGIYSHAQYESYNIAAFRYRNKHYRIRWLDLPENIRNCAELFLEEG